MLDDSRIQRYLERIGFDRDPRRDKETLDELVYRHQCSVPFETVTLHRSGKTPPSIPGCSTRRSWSAGSAATASS